MSLVGTRPILQDELLKYELHHRARIAIKPGITGMWQVSGRSDITDFEEVVRLDTEYISKAIGRSDLCLKNIELSPLAETWECSTHPDGVSTVCCGTFDKMKLTAVIKAHPEYLGERHKGETTLPILVKLIDARKDLSVQVHPDDDYAKMKEHGQLGKTEMRN